VISRRLWFRPRAVTDRQAHQSTQVPLFPFGTGPQASNPVDPLALRLVGRERLPPRRSLSSIYDFRQGRSMAAVTKRKRRLQRYTSAEFKPYVVALGQLALAWNDLQESLAALFWTLANPPPQPGDRVNYIPLRIWASIKSDRIQREILKTVINHSQTNWGRDRVTKDLIWLVDKANSLEDSRNDAVHSPLLSVDKSLYETGSEKIAPARWLFNPRAAKLSERSRSPSFRKTDKWRKRLRQAV
jgi:hypothetical protein